MDETSSMLDGDEILPEPEIKKKSENLCHRKHWTD